MSGIDAARWIAALPADDPLLLRTGAAPERAAGLLRRMIRDGALPPGTRLTEEELTEALGISRNSLREAFRALVHERLAVHQLNRGVFVRQLSAGEITDLFRLRRLVELSAIRQASAAPRAAVDQLALVVTQADEAARQGQWRAVGTADIRYHQAIGQLHGSRRIDDLMTGLLTELRLAFHAFADPQALHSPYVEWNATIATLIAAGQLTTAEAELAAYLSHSEQRLLTGVADRER